MATSGIYEIVNIINEKRYIGLASNLNSRKQGHIYDLRRGKHGNPYLQNAWNKYGESSFIFRCLEECSKENLYKREDYWVKVLMTTNDYYGYNIRETNPDGYVIVSQETRNKISNTHKKIGIRPSQLCIDNRKKVKMSEEGRAKQIMSVKRIDFNQVNKPKRKKIINTLTGHVYESLKIASENINMSKSNLSRILLGKRKNNINLIYLD